MPNRKSPRRALIDLECSTLSDSRLLKLEAAVQAVIEKPPRRRRSWTDGLLDKIYIIGGWFDPTASVRGRVWWLATFAIYGAFAAHLVGAGQWKFEYLAHGLTMLLVLFLLAFVLGLLAEIRRIKCHHRDEGDVQVSVLTGFN